MTARRALALLSPELASLVLAIACMAVLTATTAAGAELVGPVLHGLVTGDLSARSSWLARLLPAHRLRDDAWFVPALLVGLALVKGGAYFGQFFLVGMAGQRVASRLRSRLLSALVEAGPAFLASQRTGDLLTRLSSDVGAVELGVTYALAAYVRDTLTALVLFGLCLVLDWRLSLLAFGLLPLTVGPLVRLARRLLKATRRVQARQSDLGQSLAEGLQGLRLVQVDGLEGRETDRFRRLSREQLRDELRVARLRALGSPLMEVVAVLGLCLMLWVAATEVARGSLSPDHLVSFLAAALLLAQPLKSLGKVGPLGTSALAALERLFETEDAARRHAPKLLEGLGAVAPGLEEIAFEGVWFRYSEEGDWLLRGLDLRLRRGERLGLAGPSGCGKTTLVSLLLGLRAPSRGRICLNGRDLAELPLGIRRRLLAWVGQEALLLDATVAENVALGVAVEPARLEAALRRAGAWELVGRMGGPGSRVGERGARLSGGERQRLSIARAFYRDAPLLLLDEPTSQLDAETERRVGEALEGLLADRTALVVAHRPATLLGCHRVALLDGGRIVEEGSPRELAASGGAFARLLRTAAPAPRAS